MRLVHEQQRAVLGLEFDQLGQRRAVAVHAEDRLRQDEHPRVGMLPPRPLEMVLQLAQGIVREHPQHGSARPGGVHERSVAELVQDQDIVLVDDRPDGSGRRRVAAGERQRGLRALELSELFFQPAVRRPRAADQPRRPRADAVLVDGGLGGLAQERIIGQPEVIVGGEVDQPSAGGQFHRAVRRRLHLAQPPVQGLAFQAGEFTLERIVHRGYRTLSAVNRSIARLSISEWIARDDRCGLPVAGCQLPVAGWRRASHATVVGLPALLYHPPRAAHTCRSHLTTRNRQPATGNRQLAIGNRHPGMLIR